MERPTRPCVSMGEIMDHICRESGIEADLEAATDAATAAKVLSLARYLVATDSKALFDFEVWQYTHDGPCQQILEVEDIEDLLGDVACDEWLIAGLFAGRVKREPAGTELVAFETTVTVPNPHVPGHSPFDDEDEYGIRARRNTARLLVLASLPTGRPIAYLPMDGRDATGSVRDHLLEEYRLLMSREVTLLESIDDVPALYLTEDFLRAICPEDEGASSPSVSVAYRNGRIFVQFVATCLACALTQRLAEIQASLPTPDEDGSEDEGLSPDQRTRYALARWLRGRSCSRVLAWFDVVRRDDLPPALEAHRWGAEALACDRLLCDLLGITVSAS